LAEQRALWEARSDRLVEFVERRHQEEQDVSQPRRPR
ncbi:transcriptional regulator, partial [Burkholderia contaminans]